MSWAIINESSAPQAANTGYFGPTSGSDAAPTFRAQVVKDLPFAPYMPQNIAINSGFWFGSMRANPDTSTSYSDDTYGMDCWNMLSQGATVSCQRIAGTNGEYAMRIGNNTGSSNRVGCCQIIESHDSIPLRSKDVVFKCRIKCSETKNLRISIIGHAGTADSVTSDVVGTWTSTTFTTAASGNFFADAGGVGDQVLTAQVACTANTWRDAVVTGTVGSVVNNCILVITCDDTISASATVDIEEVDFYLGTEVTTNRVKANYSVEQRRAQRFFIQFVGQQYMDGYKANGSQIYTYRIAFPVHMRTVPTGTVTTTPTYNNNSASSTQVASYNRNAAAYTTISGALTMTATAYSNHAGLIYLTAGTSFNGTVQDVQSIDFGSAYHTYWSAAL